MRDAEHRQRQPVQLGQQQIRNGDRGEDDHAAHRRRARLRLVALRALLADVLAELAVAQQFDELRAQEQADQQRRDAGQQDRARCRPLADRERQRPRHDHVQTTPRSTSRATVTSSNGSLRPLANSWPCSCPLPAITTTSPARADSIGGGDSRVSVGVVRDVRTGALEDLGDDRLGILRAGVVGGDEHVVGQPTSDLAHQRALASIAVAAAAEHHPQPDRVKPRAARSTFSSESGVWA